MEKGLQHGSFFAHEIPTLILPNVEALPKVDAKIVVFHGFNPIL